MTIDEKYTYLHETRLATQDEIDLVCQINGYSDRTMDDIKYALTGEYFDEEDEDDDEEEEEV